MAHSPQDSGVWPQNIAAVTAFLAISSQWRLLVLPDGKRLATGLDYTAARAGLEMAGITVEPMLWAKIRVIEQGAMAAINED